MQQKYLHKQVLHVFYLVVVLLFNGQANAGSSSQERQQKQEISIEKSATTNSSTPLKSINNDYLWIEEIHETISDSVYQSALWFDNFFLDENTEQEAPKTNARIRIGWEPKSRDLAEFETRFRIKVKLPHFKNKVDVILSDDDERSQNTLPLDSVNTTPETSEEHFAAAVRFTHNKAKNRLLESRVGFSGGDIFIKARHKRRLLWNNVNSLKVEPSVYYFLKDGLGTKLLLEYEHQFNDQTQFRINYSIRGSASFSGIRWKHGFYRLKQLEQNTASILGLQIEGERNGQRGFIVDKYTLSYRYRFNAIKSWLFFEVEPFVEWSETESYKNTPGIALRVEGYFYKG